MIATQLAKFRLGVFPAAFPRSLAAAAAAATDSSNFFRQIKTKNAAIEHTKLNKHSRFIWWGKLQQQPRGWGSAAQPGGKLQENRATLVCSKRHEKPKCWQQLWQAAAAAAGVSSGFSSISRAEDFPTNLNVTCEQISTRSSIHSAPTHRHIETLPHCVAA